MGFISYWIWRGKVNELANHPFIKVTRVIKDNKFYQIETEHKIVLNAEVICTSTESFLIEEVLDMSYRFFSGEFGFLYLHTTRGMYSYIIRKNPKLFIEEYKRILLKE